MEMIIGKLYRLKEGVNPNTYVGVPVDNDNVHGTPQNLTKCMPPGIYLLINISHTHEKFVRYIFLGPDNRIYWQGFRKGRDPEWMIHYFDGPF